MLSLAVPADRTQRLGRYEVTAVGGERVRAFIPPPLPPVPAIDLGPLLGLLDRANQALGRLDGVASILPYPPLFLYMYVRKEAVLSSQIEGTQSSLSDLLLYEAEEAPGVPLEDVREVSNYVAAMDHGLARLKEGFPLSLRVLREIHGILLARGRGETQDPGEFRRSQNWIGGTRPGNAVFVPPPAHEVMRCMGDLERFLHAETPGIPLLVKAGLAHVQFETIHPFLDGNGRLGRLLITLFLCERGVLCEPLLYLSLYFKANRSPYYEHLQAVRETGDWERWLDFFLTGVLETSTQATDAARRILEMFDADRRAIEALGRPASSALRVHQLLQTKPLITIPMAAQALGLSRPTIASSLVHLQQAGVVRETTGRQRGRAFVYDRYLTLLEEGTEPLRSP
jgi:cell filamentation protein, protein adenylyltransferase